MQHQVIGTQPQDAGRRLFAPFRGAFSVTDSAKRNFIIQLGFEEPAATDIARQYSALTFQPRIVLIAIIVGMLFQSRAGFAALGALLWWSALFPELSLFNALYNQTLGRWPGRFRLTPSPAPRRAAETEAGTIALTIALLLNAGFGFAAYMVEGILLAAALAVRFGGFCTGSFIYHVVRGEWKFALRTLPWAG